MRLCSRRSKDVKTATCRKCRDYRWSSLNICERFRLAQLRLASEGDRIVAMVDGSLSAVLSAGLVAGPGDGHGRHRGGRDMA